MKKACPECGEEFIGRSDKRYCSTYCRSAHNNKINSNVTKLIRNTNNTLRKNRRILEGLNPSGKTKTHRDILTSKGFNFNLLTSVYTTQTGKTYRYCYEQGYMELDNEFYLLVKNEKT